MEKALWIKLRWLGYNLLAFIQVQNETILMELIQELTAINHHIFSLLSSTLSPPLWLALGPEA